MLPESGCCLALGFAGSMQTTHELSPRSAEPAVLGGDPLGGETDSLGTLGPLGDHHRDSLEDDGEATARSASTEPASPGGTPHAVLHTLKGLSMTVADDDGDSAGSATPVQSPAPQATPPAAPVGRQAPTPTPSPLADSPSRPQSASSRSSPSMTLDRLSPAMSQSHAHQQAAYHQQQQLQLRQIHQRIREQQQQQLQQQQQQQRTESSRASETGRGRGRRRSRWKLKFHHQALPPEYLDHYEASLASQQGGGKSSRVDSGDDKARVIGSRAPRNPKRPAPAANAAAPASAVDHPVHGGSADGAVIPGGALPPLAPKPAGEQEAAGVRTAFPTAPLPIPVPMPFGLEVLTRYQALLGQGRTDLDPAAFVAGNLMTLMSEQGQGQGQAAVKEDQSNGQRALLSTLLGTVAGSGGRRVEANADGAQPAPARAANKVMTYQDLPYMGEMTLDNMKPRRGRKPKKADICHLIYKNYGTVFPRDSDAPVDAVDVAVPAAAHRLPLSVTASVSAPAAGLSHGLALAPRLSRSDVQSRIISSLLEKRLTQEEQAQQQQQTQQAQQAQQALQAQQAQGVADEPLNLCVREQHKNPLKIKLMRRHGNFYESNGLSASPSGGSNADVVKSEPASPQSEVIEVDADPSLVNQEDDDDDDMDMDGKQADAAQDMLYYGHPAGGMAGGMYVHPLLYAKGFPALPSDLALPPLPLQVMSPLPPLPPLPPLLRLPGLDDQPPTSMAAPPPRAGRQDRQDAASKQQHQTQARAGRGSGSGGKGRPSPSPSASPASSPGLSPAPSPPKRKRSAIFIPPVPSESSNNPTTEVSICKFKFTGGAKPSLQEKKMLSVDAGGNFRYYSGTGDKSMRGYEFFPRESMQQQQQLQLQQQQQQQQQHQLQQQQLLSKPYSPQPQQIQQPQPENLRSLLFQNVIESLHMPQQGLQGSPLGTPLAPLGTQCLLGFPQAGAVPTWDLEASPPPQRPPGPHPLYHLPRPAPPSQPQQRHSFPLASRKRKTRKSVEREKLERTFKEKGFLIQTQQLESAEGATYCKFRQLRKFTRYLFRSWKDYLPGGVVPAEAMAEAADGEGGVSSSGGRGGAVPGAAGAIHEEDEEEEEEDGVDGDLP